MLNALEAAMRGKLFGAKAAMHGLERPGMRRFEHPRWIVLLRDPRSGKMTLRTHLWRSWQIRFTGIESMQIVATLVNRRRP